MSAFNNMAHSIRDRNWGGTCETIACEPYVSGYSYIAWSLPFGLSNSLCKVIDRNPTMMLNMQNDPTFVESNGGTGGNGPVNADDPTVIADVLEHSMNSVTPPGGTLNKVEIQGIGGLKWAVPGSMDYGNSISIKYLEFSGLPIHKIHRAWFNLIRDNHSGNTSLVGMTDQDSNSTITLPYNKSSYSGCLLYWTTKPDGLTVEFAAAYSGVFPTKDPMDLFSGDITSIDKLEIEIEYNVDMIYNEDWVYDTAQKFSSDEYAKKPDKTRHLIDGFRRHNLNGQLMAENGMYNWTRYDQDSTM